MKRIFIPKFRSIHHLLVLLGLLWLFIFIYHERLAPYFAVSKCSWDPKVQQSTKVLLIADPQLIDNHTYPGRNDLLLKLSQHTVDTYLKRNYQALINNLQPDNVIFLGDYLDNGRSSTDDYFTGQCSRFRNIFYTKKIQKTYQKDKNWFVNLPGNHDVGFGDGVNLPHRQRFVDSFGNPNQVIQLNNVDFVTIDSLSYSAQDSQILKVLLDFVDNLPSKSNPRVLLSHIPLFRNKETDCGPYRENPPFRPMVKGYQYQTTLTPEKTENLLMKIQPDVIFSGDDHDYCEVVHNFVSGKQTHEYTVKSISMAMGIKYPAVQLLTYGNYAASGFEYTTDICYVQTPYVNVIAYVIMAIISALLILWWNIKQRSSRYNYSILPTMNTTSIAMKSRISSPASTTPSSTILSSSSLNSRKISNFLKDQDSDEPANKINNNYFQIPTYTSTSLNTPSFATKLSQKFQQSNIGKTMNNSTKGWKKFVKKWNIVPFFKHCTYFGLCITSLYYFGFCWTL